MAPSARAVRLLSLMPLYECEQCHSVDNTALTNFWLQYVDGAPKLCSACDPAIGAWHGQFPRLPVEAWRAAHPKAELRFPCLQGEGKPR